MPEASRALKTGTKEKTTQSPRGLPVPDTEEQAEWVRRFTGPVSP